MAGDETQQREVKYPRGRSTVQSLGFLMGRQNQPAPLWPIDIPAATHMTYDLNWFIRIETNAQNSPVS